ncbi:MAG: Asp-tRNA(Asn)/Glu-tRNA(Gln) amidotransferase subunit GatC [Coriobacteriia bacterium]|nr:Asp-tRNA(Asn)/Glu-tRNA(Gln) amidotransferase subunit GatC [Coriobacteriia bacterium]MBS5477651.1 Asp-tRNA(Asn)/Glu-tRNA(Gln) amidotransferase subunit GatC [Coriobacteriia bacterium]
MSLSQNDVRGIADYARIALTDEELVEMTAYLNDAVDNVLAPIRAYELDGVEPVFHPIGDLSNVMRDDVPAPGLPLGEALENAGQSEGRFFRVPSILGNGGER